MESTEKFLIGNFLKVSHFPARNVPVREFASARTTSFLFQRDRQEWHGIKADFGEGFLEKSSFPADPVASGSSLAQGFFGKVGSVSALSVTSSI